MLKKEWRVFIFLLNFDIDYVYTLAFNMCNVELISKEKIAEFCKKK